MFQTLKIPYKTSIENLSYISILQNQFSNIFRCTFNNCFKFEKIIQKKQRDLVKDFNNIEELDSWWLMNAVGDGIGYFESVKQRKCKKVIFGGKNNFNLRKDHKISNEQWKQLRLRKIISCGEQYHKGNRKFTFDIIIFKPKRKLKIELTLPKLRKNYKNILKKLQLQMELKQIPVTIGIDQKFLYITFENKKEFLHKSEGSYAGLDLNPNFIALSLFNKNKERIKSFTWNLSKLTQKSHESSSSNKSKYLDNKLDFETVEISKNIDEICNKFNIDFIFFEKLSFNNSMSNKWLNRLCKNKWKKNLFIGNLKKRFDISGIKWFEINPAYSSFIGNILNGLPDPISASIEIARRGYEVIIQKTGRFYPVLENYIESLMNRWKEELDLSNFAGTWKELFSLFKNSKVKYRVSWSIDHVFRKFYALNSNVSYICL